MTQQMSGTNARFLNRNVVLSEVFRVMEPNLVFNDLIPFVNSEGQPIVYGKKNSKSADPKKQKPRLTTPSSKFPEVQITRMTKETALTSAEGLSIRFDKSALTLPAGKDMIMDGLSTLGFWIAEYINTAIYDTMRAEGTNAGMTPTATWDLPNATPLVDLENFTEGMVREGYPYRCTDVFVESDNFKEAKSFLMASERAIEYNAVMGRPMADTINLPSGQTLHRMFSGMTHGDLMGLDRRNKTHSTLYYNNDSVFGTPDKIKYDTVVNGQTITKTVDNFGINTFVYFENDTHDTVLQVWGEFVPVVKDAFGIIVDSGI